jgi:pyruvate dehydrogenase E2 component (dihydrolipoamide acetyltransferase)
MALVEVKVPDIGDFKDVEIIEVMVKPGDSIKEEQSLITVESDKASMEIPSSAAGVVKELKVKVGDKVGEGSLVLVLESTQAAEPASPAPAVAQPTQSEPSSAARKAGAATAGSPPAPSAATAAAPTAALPPVVQTQAGKAHASPSVRAFARELGVDINRVGGTGPKGRITHDDVRGYVKGAVAAVVSGTAGAVAAPLGGGGGNVSVIDWPKVDFTKFGEIETKPLSRIKKLSGANLHRNWVVIPHVTNHDDADITELEAFRVQLNEENAKNKDAVKVTMLAFLIKACVSALKKFPEFNASLDGENLVLKKYFHIGFAADTPNGLVVPVIKDADKKGVFELAKETAELAALAREGKLTPTQMSGGCFSISSLGGIGGTYFTPIINAPEVAILGVCRSATRPVWNGKEFAPRLILPLSLSWDHRVIDGASAARFNTYLAGLLADFRRTML